MTIPAPIVVGDITIHRIVEQEQPLFETAQFFPDLTEEMYAPNKSWLEPRYFSGGRIVLCIQSYVVRTRHHTIMIDTCVGNHKERPNRAFWHRMTSDRYEKNLAAAGFAPSDIDYVMCTHLHGDHVGWNTKLDNGRWVPTFSNAKYLFSGRELDYWTGRHSSDAAAFAWIGDSVLPVVEAGRVERVTSDHRVGDDVQLIPTPGHTPDHFSVEVGGSGASAIITGDAIHSPIQVLYPELGMFSDYDRKQSGISRRRLLTRCCENDALMCPAHFGSPSVGRIKPTGEGFRFVEG